ncbi:MAG: hypothetical protein WDN24_05750 [Sphingomonas sp.]
MSSDPARAFDVVGNSPGEAPFVFVDPSTGTPYFKGFAQILRRNVEGGGRQDDRQHTSYRGVLGLKGDLGSVWSYDTYYQYGTGRSSPRPITTTSRSRASAVRWT